MPGKSIQTLELVLAAIMALGLAVVPVSAIGSGQQAGGAPGGIYNWYELAPGESAEWVLRYPGQDKPALVAFGVDPVGAIEVKVYDDWKWRALGAGDRSVEPVGRGTGGTAGKWDINLETVKAGDLFWEAGAGPAVVFHIQVTNRSQQPARYWIAQAGPGVGELVPVSPLTPAYPSQPQPSRSPQPSPQPKAQAQPPAIGVQGPPLTLPVTGGPEPNSHFNIGLRAE